jgi:hypothetical protein
MNSGARARDPRADRLNTGAAASARGRTRGCVATHSCVSRRVGPCRQRQGAAPSRGRPRLLTFRLPIERVPCPRLRGHENHEHAHVGGPPWAWHPRFLKVNKRQDGAKKSGPRTSQIRFDSTNRSGASEPVRQTSFEAPRASKVELATAFVATNGILLMHSACHMLSPARYRSPSRVATRDSIKHYRSPRFLLRRQAAVCAPRERIKVATAFLGSALRNGATRFGRHVEIPARTWIDRNLRRAVSQPRDPHRSCTLTVQTKRRYIWPLPRLPMQATGSAGGLVAGARLSTESTGRAGGFQ